MKKYYTKFNERNYDDSMNKKNTTITYIKKGKEYKQNLTRFNQKFVLQKIFDPEQIGYSVKSDIEYLEMENFSFAGGYNIECVSQDTFLVLTNCQFGLYTSFSGGSIQLNHPGIKDLTTGSIRVSGVQDFILKTDITDIGSLDYTIESATNVTFQGNGQNTISSIFVRYCHNVLLERFHYTKEEFDLFQVGNIEMKNSYVQVSNILATQLELWDTELYSEDNLKLFIKKLVGKRYALIIKGDKFILGDNTWYKSPDQDQLTFSDQDFRIGSESAYIARTNLIAILKTLENDLNSENQKTLKSIESQLVKKKIRTFTKYQR